ncbi:hypothetical protein GSY69_09155, partial [Brevibacterium sp. 5221]
MPEPAGAAPPRWAQITYASFDRGDGSPGGWQVKDETGRPSAQEQRELRRRAISRFDYHGALPKFLTAEAARGLPVRMRYEPGGEPGTGIYAHAVLAGTDSTGRPGNVYSHVALDREPAGAQRPIDFWRSPSFAAPFGVEGILAVPAPEEPQPTAALAGRAILPAVFATAQYAAALLAAADAVAGWARGGRRLVLLTDRQDWAALLIAAVTALMSPQAARGVGWTMYARAAELDAADLAGCAVIVVPTADAAALERREDIWILPDGFAPQRTADGAHALERGAVPATEFSALIEAVLAQGYDLEAVLGALDALPVEPGGTAPIDPAWPLATVGVFSGFAGEAAAAAFAERAPLGALAAAPIRARLLEREAGGLA